MTIEILAMRRSDVPRVLPLVHRAHPCRAVVGEAMLRRHDQPAPGTEETGLIAVEDGTVVGFLRSVLRRDDGGTAHGRSFLATVADSHLDTDVGSRLLEASERVLLDRGAGTLRAEAAEEGVQRGGEGFRRAVLDRGYVPEDTHRVLGLDLSGLPGPPPAPAGVELRPFTDYAADPRPLYEIDRLTSLDEPGAGARFPSYPEWRESVWDHPLAALDLCLLALVGGVPAAITCFLSGGGRLESSMTGTLREHRGRGLAGYAKTVALHRARDRGRRPRLHREPRGQRTDAGHQRKTRIHRRRNRDALRQASRGLSRSGGAPGRSSTRSRWA
ncbi:N-acetyltransferase [Nocardiopsis sp. FR6]|uniref:N-acetyltransferase n=1 Tax=unclassified Nocardiopsis TaxID=2649073 RepID=UPI00351A7111